MSSSNYKCFCLQWSWTFFFFPKKNHFIFYNGERTMNNINYVRNYWSYRKAKQSKVWPLFHSVSHLTLTSFTFLKCIHCFVACWMPVQKKNDTLQIYFAFESAQPHTFSLSLAEWLIVVLWMDKIQSITNCNSIPDAVHFIRRESVTITKSLAFEWELRRITKCLRLLQLSTACPVQWP